MSQWLHEFRLLPVVLIAAGCLLALKLLGLIFDGGYTLAQRLGSSNTLVVTTAPMAPTPTLRSPASPLETAPAPGSRLSWMQEMFNYPDITGSVDKPKGVTAETDAKPAARVEPAGSKPAATAPAAPDDQAAGGTVIPLDASRPSSAAERALLERLHARREQLDARARELDLRESMLKAVEKKLETHAAGDGPAEAKAAASQRKQDVDVARFKALVTMYETMKPKDAARIFDRLDIKVLLEVASKINPRRMSEILAQMSPEAAERLTVELAARVGAAVDRATDPASLPKIEGRPGGG